MRFSSEWILNDFQKCRLFCSNQLYWRILYLNNLYFGLCFASHFRWSQIFKQGTVFIQLFYVCVFSFPITWLLHFDKINALSYYKNVWLKFDAVVAVVTTHCCVFLAFCFVVGYSYCACVSVSTEFHIVLLFPANRSHHHLSWPNAITLNYLKTNHWRETRLTRTMSTVNSFNNTYFGGGITNSN